MKSVASWEREIVALAGLGLVAYGLQAIYPPAAFIAVGLVLLGLAVWRLL